MEEQDEIKVEQNGVSGKERPGDGTDYIEAIKEMKKNSVSREQYEKVQQENKELLEALINGGQVNIEQVEEKPDIKKLREELFSAEACEKGMTNLEFVEKALKLRDAIIESGGNDPFLPVGRGVDITREDYESAEFVAQQFKECVEKADGNSEVFTAELMRRTVDTGIPKPAKQNSYYRR